MKAEYNFNKRENEAKPSSWYEILSSVTIDNIKECMMNSEFLWNSKVNSFEVETTS